MDPSPLEDERDVLGLPETADVLGVHYMTAYRYVRTGRLPAVRVRGVWQVHRRDLERLRAMPEPGARTPGGSRTTAAALLESRLVAGDARGAAAVVDEAMVSWADRSDVYMAMLVPALRRIGARWAAGTLSVAQEHRATATAVRVIGQLGQRFAERGRESGSVVVGTVAGERHAIPVAIVADMLRAAGLTPVELGADVPAPSFVDAAGGSDRLVAVAVGATVSGQERAIAETVALLHRELPGVPVIVGGAGVTGSDVARLLGADRWSGPDAPGVVEQVREILRAPGGRGRQPPAGADVRPLR